MINIGKVVVFEHFVIKFDNDNTKQIDIKYRAHSTKSSYQLMYRHQRVPIIKIWSLG